MLPGTAEPLCSPGISGKAGGFLQPPPPHPAQLQPSWTEGQTDRRRQSRGDGELPDMATSPRIGAAMGVCVCVLGGGGGPYLLPSRGEKDTASRLPPWCRWPSRAGWGRRPGRWAGWGSRAPPSAAGTGRSESGPPTPAPSQTPHGPLLPPWLQSCTSLSFPACDGEPRGSCLVPHCHQGGPWGGGTSLLTQFPPDTPKQTKPNSHTKGQGRSELAQAVPQHPPALWGRDPPTLNPLPKVRMPKEG